MKNYVMCLLLLASTTIGAENKKKKPFRSLYNLLTHLTSSCIDTAIDIIPIFAGLYSCLSIYTEATDINNPVDNYKPITERVKPPVFDVLKYSLPENSDQDLSQFPELKIKPSIQPIQPIDPPLPPTLSFEEISCYSNSEPEISLGDYRKRSNQELETFSPEERELFSKLNQLQKEYHDPARINEWREEFQTMIADRTRNNGDLIHPSVKEIADNVTERKLERKYTQAKQDYERNIIEKNKKSSEEYTKQQQAIFVKKVNNYAKQQQANHAKIANDYNKHLNDITQKHLDITQERQKMYNKKQYLTQESATTKEQKLKEEYRKHIAQINKDIQQYETERDNLDNSKRTQFNQLKNEFNTLFGKLSQYRVALLGTVAKSCAIIFGLQMIVKPTWHWMRKELRTRKNKNQES